MKLIYHAPLFVGQEMLQAPVYIRKRNAGRKTGSPLSSVPPFHPPSSLIWILRAVNESRPIKFLFQVGCRDVITRARYAISAASPSSLPPLSAPLITPLTHERPSPSPDPGRAPKCLTLSFGRDEGMLRDFT